MQKHQLDGWSKNLLRVFMFRTEKMYHQTMPTSVEEMQKQGLEPLSAKTLKARVWGKCFFGVFRFPFLYTMKIAQDGALWGRNNYGTEDSGLGAIDETTGAFTVSWQNHWEANTSFGYLVDNAIHLFDVQTGEWKTTLLREIDESELFTSF